MTQYDTHRSLFGTKLVRARQQRRVAITRVREDGSVARTMTARDGQPAPFVRDRKLVAHVQRQNFERAVREALRLAVLGLSRWLGYGVIG